MNNTLPNIYYVINNLSKDFSPYERMQLLTCDPDTIPPTTYQYYPNVPEGCEIAAEMNLSRIGDKLLLHKLKVFNNENRTFITSYLISHLNLYAVLSGYNLIYTTPTQYEVNNL